MQSKVRLGEMIKVSRFEEQGQLQHRASEKADPLKPADSIPSSAAWQSIEAVRFLSTRALV